MKALCIDLGGTSAKIGVVEAGEVLRETTVPTRPDSDYFGIVHDLVAAARTLTEQYAVTRVGIGSPGLIDTATGRVCFSNNIRWNDFPLRDDIAAELRLPVAIANDAKCATLGEAVYGAGRGYDRVAMLTIGTGVGGGFAVGGKLESGSVYADASGIFGHMTLVADGKECNCGRKGCVESYCSATAIAARATAVFGEEMTAKDVFALAAERNRVAKKIVDDFARYLGIALGSIANILRPQCIVIGGGVSAAADAFLPAVRKVVSKEVYGEKYAPVEVVAAKLGNRAGMIGASLL